MQLGNDGQTKPVVGGAVSVKGVGNPARTVADGYFYISLPSRDFPPGQPITLKVHEVPGWQIFEPAGGEWLVPAVPKRQAVTLKLLPLGAMQFLQGDRIAKAMQRLMSEVKNKPSGQSGKKAAPVDLKGPLQKWAIEYGFGLEEVQVAVDKWASDVLKRRQANSEEPCLALFAQKKLNESAMCFQSLGQDDFREIEKPLQKYEKLQQQLLAKIEQAVRRFGRAGEAYEAQYNFGAALAVYEQAAKAVPRDVAPRQWAEVQNWLGSTHLELSIRIDGDAASEHLRKAVTAHRSALAVYDRETAPEGWAATQNCLGNVLLEQAKRVPGEAGKALMADAIAAYRSALEVRTRAVLPQDWAATQNNLGNALQEQAEHTLGEPGNKLLGESVAAYQAALAVYTRAANPLGWGMIQNNLGNVLHEQAKRTAGEAGNSLLSESVAAYRAALEVYLRETQPQDWAMTQDNLGNVLHEQAKRVSGEAGSQLLTAAVAAYRSALEVNTRDALPQEWARTQNNLGATLREQAKRTPGQAGNTLLTESLAAYELALTVRTREALPQDWATTQNNIGFALHEQAGRIQGEAQTKALTEATHAYRAALEVFTFESHPLHWEKLQANLIRACAFLRDEGCLAEVLMKVRQRAPDNVGLYDELCWAYQDKLFDFAKAFSLEQDWLARHPDDKRRWISSVESHLTTGRLAEVLVKLAALPPDILPRDRIVLGAVEVAALSGLDRLRDATAKRKAMREIIAAQPTTFKLGWSFGGTRQFIAVDPRFASSRKQFLGMLDALQLSDRAAILQALDLCCTQPLESKP